MSSNPKKSILIVEDEENLSYALATQLNKEGYQVTTVNNGQEALGMLNSIKPSLVLMDLIMPKMDGWAFLEELKKNKPDLLKTLPIIVMTNLASDERSMMAIDAGAKEYLIKAELSLAQICDVIKKYI